MFFVLSETRRMKGLRGVLTMCCRNLSCFSRSTENCESWAFDRTLTTAFPRPALGCSSVLKKSDCVGDVAPLAAAADPFADSFYTEFQHLVIVPGVMAPAECCWAGAKNVL